jgi:transposase
MARIAQSLLLQTDETFHLESLLRRRTLEDRIARRCRALLLAAQGMSNVEIAVKLDMHRNAISNIRTRFGQVGLACLEDAPRSGKPPTHSAQTKQKVVTTVCGKPPKGMSRWSTQSLAKKLKLSKSYVHGVLKEHDLHPHRLRTFNFSPDPQFEEKLLEVVGLYMNPPENALIVCMDEKTGIQALDRTQPVLPLRGGKPKSWSNEYVRHGTQTM